MKQPRATYGFIDENGNRVPGHSRIHYCGQIKLGQKVLWRCSHGDHYWQYQAVTCAQAELFTRQAKEILRP